MKKILLVYVFINNSSEIIIGINDRFYRWIMKSDNNIEIISPENIHNEFQEELQKILSKYQK